MLHTQSVFSGVEQRLGNLVILVPSSAEGLIADSALLEMGGFVLSVLAGPCVGVFGACVA